MPTPLSTLSERANSADLARMRAALVFSDEIAMDALIVVDMQVGLLQGAPKYDLHGVVHRINSLAEKVRIASGNVIWIRHCGRCGSDFEANTPGWEFLPQLARRPEELVVNKTLNDPFIGTPLADHLDRVWPRRVLVTGWATDFCVDATVRSSVSRDYNVIAVSDAHTLSDRPHLSASTAIAYHNWLWGGLITNRSVRVASTRELLLEPTSPDQTCAVIRRSDNMRSGCS
jgi:nicotinamidase-related amidase